MRWQGGIARNGSRTRITIRGPAGGLCSGGEEGEAMIIIPPEEVDEFLANESGTLFTDEQLTFFRRASEQRKRGLF